MKIFDYFDEYNSKGIYPFHMPGNKRTGDEVNRYDFTEIYGMDNLYHPNGMLQTAMARIARLCGARESLILVNGSTAGLLAAITATTEKGDEILIARNCHKAAYNAADIWELKPRYIVPPVSNGISGCINPWKVEEILKENVNIKAFVLTSPTYEGVVSDIKSISDICRRYNVTLIVDEAHGSHMKFSGYFPAAAVDCGADIVVQSAHKTLTALTGTGLLHICSDRVDSDAVKQYCRIFQTSSPNYLMIASVDKCFCDLENKGGELFESYTKNLEEFYTAAAHMKNLRIFRGEGEFDFDRGKIVILTNKTNITGVKLQSILRKKYLIETEMSGLNHIVAMTSINDSSEGFKRLSVALKEIDSSLTCREYLPMEEFKIPPYAMSAYRAKRGKGECVPLKKAVGRISREYIYAYPPGIPIVVPGEKFTPEVIREIATMQANNINIISDRNKLPYSVECAIDTQ